MTKKTRKISRPYLSIPITLDEVLSTLANTKGPLSSSHLAELSDLNPDSFSQFCTAWQKFGTTKRRNILLRLEELADENVELNFDNIFKLGLGDKYAQVRSAAINGLWENRQTWLRQKLVNFAAGDASAKVRLAAVRGLERFCLDAELRNESGTGRQLADTLLSIFENIEASIEMRRRALEAVSPLDLPEVHKALESAFHSENRDLKVSAVYGMGASSNPRWLTLLMPELKSSDAETRYEAAYACGKIGEEDPVNLLAALLDDEDRDVQLAAIRALGRIGGIESKEVLTRIVKSPDELLSDVAKQALYELELYDDPLSPDI